ncbi:MAG TPA: vWA domain-containing protein [Polyangia bacterium]|nr:vWA domain-containing protein [Polyangia bacterium]
MRGVRLGSVLFTLVTLPCLAVGCKTVVPPPETGSGGSTGIDAGGSGGKIGGPDAGSPLDMSQEKFSAGEVGDTSEDGACAATSSSAKLVPLDLYVMMDSSKSMTDTDSSGKSKWDDLKSAMSSFFNDANSAGFSVAMKYFPDEQSGIPETCTADADCKTAGPCDQRKACVVKGTFSKTPQTLCSTAADCQSTEECVAVQHCTMGPDCMARNCVKASDSTMSCPSDCTPFTGYCRGRDICDANAYATPTVPFGVLPDAASALISSLNGHSPGGYTPTGPALTGALKAAQQRAKDVPDHKVVVVLVTDGLPGAFIPNMAPAACTPADVPGVASLLSGPMGFGATPSIPTFVIGIFGPCDLQQGNAQMPKEKLNTWAAAGGTKEAVLVDTSQDVTTKILDAFKMVQSKVITCQYTIPKPSVGGLDYKKVNVAFTSADQKDPLYIHYVGTKDKCDGTAGGWYYDNPPEMGGAPTQIIACDQSCTMFKAAKDAEVKIALGCATIG